MGGVLGAVIGIVILIVFVIYIIDVFSQGIREQREVMAFQRQKRELKKSQSDFRDFATAAVKQTVLDSHVERTLAGRNLLATDGSLHSYSDSNVDWKEIWNAAVRQRHGVPPYGRKPYWLQARPGASPYPLSILAFWGTEARLRIARDLDTEDTTIAMLAGDQNMDGRPDPGVGDPDSTVQATAARRL